MRKEQDPWAAVPGGVYPQRRGGIGGMNRRDRGGGLRWLWLAAPAIAGYAVWTLIFSEHGVVNLKKLSMREAALTAEIGETQDRVHDLEDQVEHIDKTRQLRARTDYDMACSNEIVYETAPAESAGIAGIDAGVAITTTSMIGDPTGFVDSPKAGKETRIVRSAPPKGKAAASKSIGVRKAAPGKAKSKPAAKPKPTIRAKGKSAPSSAVRQSARVMAKHKAPPAKRTRR